MTRWLCLHLDAHGFPCNHETLMPLSICGAHEEKRREEKPVEPCAGPRCERPARVKGLCWGHHAQMKRHGKLGVLNRYHRSTLPKMEAA